MLSPGTTSSKPRKSSWPGVSEASRIAKEILGAPPCLARIVRPVARGPLLWECVVPAELCLNTNALMRMDRWQRDKVYMRVLELMSTQNGLRKRAQPISGRPEVHCIRLTSVAPDRASDWTKHVMDALVVDWHQKSQKTGKVSHRDGLGFLRDDRDSCVEHHKWWERAPRGVGIVVVRVYTGVEV
jgi:hypothetical protein